MRDRARVGHALVSLLLVIPLRFNDRLDGLLRLADGASHEASRQLPGASLQPRDELGFRLAPSWSGHSHHVVDALPDPRIERHQRGRAGGQHKAFDLLLRFRCDSFV